MQEFEICTQKILKTLKKVNIININLDKFPTLMLSRIITTSRRLYNTMTPEDYLFNQRDSMLAKVAHVKSLEPLDGANHGEALISDQVQLIGIPKGQTLHRYNMDIFEQMLTEGQRDLIFLQIDPSPYIARQRFMSHRCAMGEVEDYRLDGINLIDPHMPITWEQTVVNLLTMDMQQKNRLPHQVKYNDGMYAYSYPSLQKKEQSTAITQNFIKEISTQILDGKRTGYDMIDKVLYTGLMGRHKIMLGGMPETQYRMILGKGISVGEMRDIFRLVVSKNKELTIPMGIKEATQNFLPHIFLLPKDLYMTALLKQSFQASMQMLSFVGIEHWRPIQQYWVGPPHGINMTQATRIPEGFPGETIEDLIEKQALLDVMLQTRVWARDYLSNPFPYLFQDITKIDPKELENYQKIFAKHYKKYRQFKNRQVKLLQESVAKKLSLQDHTNLQKQEMQKMKSSFTGAPILSYLKNKMTIKNEKKIKIIK